MSRIGNYQITDEQLGIGGTGVVYKAIRYFGRQERQLPAACKLIHENSSTDIDLQQALENEAFLSMSLSHENLVRTYDCIQDERNTYIMMEYIDGLSLEELLHRYGPLPEGVVVHVVYSVAQALRYLHREGIVHRDIAPPNILISKAGQVKVSDLGFARTGDDCRPYDDFQGRMAFACPDRIRTKRHTMASDLWALLVTAFDAASGYLPYGPENRGETGPHIVDEVYARAVCQEIVIPAQPFSTAFDELVSDLLFSSACQRRFESADDVVRFIEENFSIFDACEALAQIVHTARTGTLMGTNGQKRLPPERRRQRLPDTEFDARSPRWKWSNIAKAMGLCFVMGLCLAIGLPPPRDTNAHVRLSVEASPISSAKNSAGPSKPLRDQAALYAFDADNDPRDALACVAQTAPKGLASEVAACASESEPPTMPTKKLDRPSDEGRRRNRLRTFAKQTRNAHVPINAGKLIPMPR